MQMTLRPILTIEQCREPLERYRTIGDQMDWLQMFRLLMALASTRYRVALGVSEDETQRLLADVKRLADSSGY